MHKNLKLGFPSQDRSHSSFEFLLDNCEILFSSCIKRVARLDELSPIGRLFTLGRFLKITVGGQIYDLLSADKIMY
jgi:hypothetical protein